MTKIVFVARLHKHSKNIRGFYVPTNVSEYYDLGTGPIEAALSWHGGKTRNISVSFTNYKGRLRGVFSDYLMPDVGTLVQVTMPWRFRRNRKKKSKNLQT
jgi:hypothetical protein